MEIKFMTALVEQDGYYANLQKEDDHILLTIIGLGDSISCNTSLITLSQDFKELIEDYEETCLSINKEIIKPSVSKVYSIILKNTVTNIKEDLSEAGLTL